ncbi:MAG: CPBP family intramembrane glutamic endopeptidase, partial [Mariprofundaceae bacterium]
LLAVSWLLDVALLARLGAPDWVHGLNGLLAMLMLAPLAEELFFRAVVYRLFRQSFGMPVAIVLSAACFAMMHGALLSPQLAGGLIFAVAYEWSRNLWVPIALHVGANAAVLLLSL